MLIEDIQMPVIDFIPNKLKASKIENAKIDNLSQYCKIFGLKDKIISEVTFIIFIKKIIFCLNLCMP